MWEELVNIWDTPFLDVTDKIRHERLLFSSLNGTDGSQPSLAKGYLAMGGGGEEDKAEFLNFQGNIIKLWVLKKMSLKFFNREIKKKRNCFSNSVFVVMLGCLKNSPPQQQIVDLHILEEICIGRK